MDSATTSCLMGVRTSTCKSGKDPSIHNHTPSMLCAPLCSFLGWFLVRCRNKTPTSPDSTYPLFICYCFMLHPSMLQTPSHMFIITPPCIFMSRLTPREESKYKAAVCSVSLHHEGLFVFFLRLWVSGWHRLHTLIQLHSICLLHTATIRHAACLNGVGPTA